MIPILMFHSNFSFEINRSSPLLFDKLPELLLDGMFTSIFTNMRMLINMWLRCAHLLKHTAHFKHWACIFCAFVHAFVTLCRQGNTTNDKYIEATVAIEVAMALTVYTEAAIATDVAIVIIVYILR